VGLQEHCQAPVGNVGIHELESRVVFDQAAQPARDQILELADGDGNWPGLLHRNQALIGTSRAKAEAAPDGEHPGLTPISPL